MYHKLSIMKKLSQHSDTCVQTGLSTPCLNKPGFFSETWRLDGRCLYMFVRSMFNYMLSSIAKYILVMSLSVSEKLNCS